MLNCSAYYVFLHACASVTLQLSKLIGVQTHCEDWGVSYYWKSETEGSN